MPVARGCTGCVATPPPKQKRSTLWDLKRFKMIKKYPGDGRIGDFNVFPAFLGTQISELLQILRACTAVVTQCAVLNQIYFIGLTKYLLFKLSFVFQSFRILR